MLVMSIDQLHESKYIEKFLSLYATYNFFDMNRNDNASRLLFLGSQIIILCIYWEGDFYITFFFNTC